MTSDEKRRDVAARLRKTRGIMAFVEELGIDFDSDWCWKDVSRRVADLIDRPTCYVVEHKTHCGSYGCEEAGTLWVLSCGDDCVNDSDFPPRYCPDCGAEVTDEGGCDVREL